MEWPAHLVLIGTDHSDILFCDASLVKDLLYVMHNQVYLLLIREGVLPSLLIAAGRRVEDDGEALKSTSGVCDGCCGGNNGRSLSDFGWQSLPVAQLEKTAVLLIRLEHIGVE